VDLAVRCLRFTGTSVKKATLLCDDLKCKEVKTALSLTIQPSTQVTEQFTDTLLLTHLPYYYVISILLVYSHSIAPRLLPGL